MRPSGRFDVPDRLALLYDFVNTLDLRRYSEHGITHVVSDAIATPDQLEIWMRERDLLDAGRTIGRAEHDRAQALRAALRALFKLNPADRATETTIGGQLTDAAAQFPLAVRMQVGKGVTLEGAGASSVSKLADVLAEMQKLENEGGLDRVKACASDECGWIFFDRSKPASRRWCSSARCGNREKTKSYRGRQKGS
jgi:predicted RNA-binding Zn ribbon-like protein